MTDRIEKTVELKAPVDRVWRALTDQAEFSQWFGIELAAPFVVGEEVGGRVKYPGMEHVTWTAVVKAMDAPDYFAFTWHPYAIDPNVDYSDEPPTLVEFRLTPSPTGTRLDIVESGFDSLPAHRREQAWGPNNRGWNAQVDNIRAHVES